MIFDTSVVVKILKDKKFFEKIKKNINEEIRLTSISVYELLRGAVYKKFRDNSERELNVILKVIESLEILPFSEKEAKISAILWGKLRKNGIAVNDADVMISSTAISNNEKLLTIDKDFEKIKKVEPKLDVEIIR